MTDLIIVGGFLGAGKTTLLAQAAERLSQRGRRVGLITNDQAANLVDTAVLKAAGSPVEEVSGGCFCCRFADLVAAADGLMREAAPDVLICEPVGSCTDLSATVLQPLRQIHADRFRLAPLSVLVDPDRAREALLDKGRLSFPGTVIYIFRKQLEEADAIVLNKADAIRAAELTVLERTIAAEFPGKPLFALSALSGDGVDAWLEFVAQDRPAGQVIAEVDYDEYAAGEAALGWLNAVVRLRSDHGADWAAYCRNLLAGLQRQFRAATAEIAHVKLCLSTDGERFVANLTGNRGTPQLRGAVDSAAREATLLLNARVHIHPDQLRAIVEHGLQAAAGEKVRAVVEDIRHFAPARPQPTHRFTRVV